MRYLLDTHSLLWFIAGDPRLSERARALIEDLDNELALSAASLWEIAVKVSLGKLPLGEPYETLIPRQLNELGVHVLDLALSDCVEVSKLPFHNRDPFDRMIIAQAKLRGLPVIGRDSNFVAYDIQMEW